MPTHFHDQGNKCLHVEWQPATTHKARLGMCVRIEKNNCYLLTAYHLQKEKKKKQFALYETWFYAPFFTLSSEVVMRNIRFGAQTRQCAPCERHTGTSFASGFCGRINGLMYWSFQNISVTCSIHHPFIRLTTTNSALHFSKFQVDILPYIRQIDCLTFRRGLGPQSFSFLILKLCQPYIHRDVISS